MKNYFQLCNSFIGEVYFRVSKHLGCLPSTVMRNKFNQDYKFLIFKYSEEIRQEQKQLQEIEEQKTRSK